MKRGLIISIFILIFATASNAGNNLPVIRWGLKAGVTLQKYDVSGYAFGFEEQLQKTRAGFQGGIMVNFGFTSFPMHVQGELLYETVGYTIDSKSGTSRLRNNRVFFPVMIGTGLELLDNLVLKAQLGPVFNILSATTVDRTENLSLDNTLMRPTVGLAAGIGLESGNFTADVRYNFYSSERSSEILNDNNTSSRYTVKQRGLWAFTVGILF